MQHAKLSASGSGQWLNCPGSVKASEGFKDRSSSAAQEGTCAHELAQICLDDSSKVPHDYVGQTLSDAPEVVVDREMANYVEEYVSYVNSLVGENCDLYVETRVDFSDWVPEGFGTSDAIVADDNAKVLHVIDLKYGKGIEVSPIENSQGMLYALGAYVEYDLIHEFDTVTIHIYQPRIGNIAEWSIKVTDLLTWANDVVRPTAELCVTDDAPRNPGDKQCTWCKAKATCPELQKHVESTIGSQFDDLDLPEVPTGIDFQNVMNNKKLIEGWLKAIEGYIFEQLEAGVDMPGFKLVTGKSSRKWTDADDVEKYMRKKKYKVGEIFTQKLITPPQCEKLMGKVKYEDISSLVIKSDGKPTLAKSSDKRPAININIANDFDEIK